MVDALGVKALAADLQRIFGTRLQSRRGLRRPMTTPTACTRWHSSSGLTFQDLAACAPLRRRTGAGRRRGPAASSTPRRVPAHARRLPARVRRHHRHHQRRASATTRSPACAVSDADLRRGMRAAGQEPSDSSARGLPRDRRRSEGRRAGSSRRRRRRFGAARQPRTASTPAIADRAGLTPATDRRDRRRPPTRRSADPSALLARYLSAVERLWQEVDRWRA